MPDLVCGSDVGEERLEVSSSSSASMMAGSLGMWRLTRRQDIVGCWKSVLPKPLVERDVDDNVVVGIMSGRADGMNSSWAILELARIENGCDVVLVRMTVISPR